MYNTCLFGCFLLKRILGHCFIYSGGLGIEAINGLFYLAFECPGFEGFRFLGSLKEILDLKPRSAGIR